DAAAWPGGFGRVAPLGRVAGAISPLAFRAQPVRGLDALPPPVTVHRVVAPADGRDRSCADLGALLVHGDERGLSTARWCVAAVEKRVHADIPYPAASRHFQHGEYLRLVAVHPARGQQSQYV